MRDNIPHFPPPHLKKKKEQDGITTVLGHGCVKGCRGGKGEGKGVGVGVNWCGGGGVWWGELGGMGMESEHVFFLECFS